MDSQFKYSRTLLILLILLSPVLLFSQKELWQKDIALQKIYAIGLGEADSLQFIRNYEAPILTLFNEQEIDEYSALETLNEKKFFINFYWRKKNPNPMLGLNYWLLEHIERFNFVRGKFSYDEYPYFDDRGKFWLKYGKPYHRYREPGGLKEVHFFKDPDVHWTVNQIYQRFSPDKAFLSSPNESWSYWERGDHMVIHFVKEGYFREVDDLTKALHTGIDQNAIWYWMDLMKGREHLSPRIDETIKKIERFEFDISQMAMGRGALPNNGSSAIPHKSLFEEIQNVKQRELIARNFFGPYRSSRVNYLNRISFEPEISQFRTDANMTRVEVTMWADVESILKQFKDKDNVAAFDLEFRGMLRNSSLNVIDMQSEQKRFSREHLAKEEMEFIVEKLSFKLEPQKNELNLQVRDMINTNLGFEQNELDIRDFGGDSLMLSDIQFYSPLLTEEQEKLLPRFLIDDQSVVSYPFQVVKKSIPLFCYFECYNLITSGIRDKYKVEIKVFQEKSGENIAKRLGKWLTRKSPFALSITQTRIVEKDAVNELISLDMNKLTSGDYILEISIQDENNKINRSITSRRFILQ